jgi:hypothetical protein
VNIYVGRGEEEAELYAGGARRCPKGQKMTIAGKPYVGGQWIPADKVALATPGQKVQLEATKQAHDLRGQARHAERSAKGPANREALTAKLAGHLAIHAPGAKIGDADKKSANASWNLYQRHHQENALHRVDELADLAVKAMAKLPADSHHRRVLARELAKFHHMASVLSQKPAPTHEEKHAAGLAEVEALIQKRGLDKATIAKALGGQPAGSVPATAPGTSAPAVVPAVGTPGVPAPEPESHAPVPSVPADPERTRLAGEAAYVVSDEALVAAIKDGSATPDPLTQVAGAFRARGENASKNHGKIRSVRATKLPDS